MVLMTNVREWIRLWMKCTHYMVESLFYWEVNVNKSFNGVPSMGMDYIAYPKAKTFSVGLNVNF